MTPMQVPHIIMLLFAAYHLLEDWIGKRPARGERGEGNRKDDG